MSRVYLVALLLLVPIVPIGFTAAAGPQSDAPHGVILRHPSPGIGSTFGWAIATLDVNGDGFGDAAVSDRTDSGNAGAVFVFLGGANGFSTVPAYTIRGASPGDQFGDGLAAIGDVDGDRRHDLAIGAPYVRSPAGGASNGRMYVFLAKDLQATTTTDAAALTLRGTAEQVRLGMRIAGGMDATGDGVPDILVGAPMYDTGRGAVYLISGALRGQARVDEVATAWVFGETPSDGIGAHGLTFLVDINKDGRAEWVVGTPRQGPDDIGRVYMILGQPVGLSVMEAAHRWWEGAQPLDNFGYALAYFRISNSLQRLVIGAYGADGTTLAGGRAYLYNPPTADNGSKATSTLKGFDAGATGGSLAAGDFNGDGLWDLILGAPVSQVNTASPGEIGYLPGPIRSGDFSAADVGARIFGDYNSGRFGHAVAVVSKPDAAHSAGILVAAYRGNDPRVHLLLNSPPVAVVTDRAVPCTGATTGFTLDGSASWDPDAPDDIYEYSWTDVTGGVSRTLGVGLELPVELPVGQHLFQLNATDVYLARSTAVAATVNVFDANIPTLDLRRPNEGIVYLLDDELIDAGAIVPLVTWGTHVDTLTVQAGVTDACSPIDRVEFWLDDQLMFVDREAPYEWSYDPHEFWPAFKHVFAIAYDKEGNGPGADCIHVVNSAWLSIHHLPVIGEGPPSGFEHTIVPDPLEHVIAGEVMCHTDGTDDLLPPWVHPLDLPL